VTQLSWRESTTADRVALKQFQCTVPGVKMKRAPWHVQHPRRWELDLQAEIHTANPRSNSQRAVLLGEAADGLAAVTIVERQGNDGTAMLAIVDCVAVALHRQEKGRSGCGDEAMEEAIFWAIGRADDGGYASLVLTAKNASA
jgi:hypothetical protein